MRPLTEAFCLDNYRNEAARLLGAAIGYVWDTGRGSWKRKARFFVVSGGSFGYGHHHPDFQEEAAEAFGGRRQV